MLRTAPDTENSICNTADVNESANADSMGSPMREN